MLFFRVFFQLQVLFTGILKGTPWSIKNKTTQIQQPPDFIIMQLLIVYFIIMAAVLKFLADR